jgi:hypothetical protein
VTKPIDKQKKKKEVGIISVTIFFILWLIPFINSDEVFHQGNFFVDFSSSQITLFHLLYKLISLVQMIVSIKMSFNLGFSIPDFRLWDLQWSWSMEESQTGAKQNSDGKKSKR